MTEREKSRKMIGKPDEGLETRNEGRGFLGQFKGNPVQVLGRWKYSYIQTHNIHTYNIHDPESHLTKMKVSR